MLRLVGPQVECLFDLGLPVEVPELPADLAAIERLLADPALLEPVVAAWDARALEFGRPSIPIDRYVRLMVIKTRTGWGYETLVREVSDSLHQSSRLLWCNASSSVSGGAAQAAWSSTTSSWLSRSSSSTRTSASDSADR
jgi:hypothetical protein